MDVLDLLDECEVMVTGVEAASPSAEAGSTPKKQDDTVQAAGSSTVPKEEMGDSALPAASARPTKRARRRGAFGAGSVCVKKEEGDADVPAEDCHKDCWGCGREQGSNSDWFTVNGPLVWNWQDGRSNYVLPRLPHSVANGVQHGDSIGPFRRLAETA